MVYLIFSVIFTLIFSYRLSQRLRRYDDALRELNKFNSERLEVMVDELLNIEYVINIDSLKEKELTGIIDKDIDVVDKHREGVNNKILKIPIYKEKRRELPKYVKFKKSADDY